VLIDRAYVPPSAAMLRAVALDRTPNSGSRELRLRVRNGRLVHRRSRERDILRCVDSGNVSLCIRELAPALADALLDLVTPRAKFLGRCAKLLDVDRRLVAIEPLCLCSKLSEAGLADLGDGRR
jgi:hypothetical protein